METQPTINEVNEITPAQENQGGTEVKMSQDQLNDLINKKFAKGAEKAKSDLLETLGVSDVDSLKAIIDAKNAADEANKTELQKLQEQIELLNKEKQLALEEAKASNKKATIASLVTQNTINDPKVFELLFNDAENSEGFNENTFIEKLKEERPSLFGQAQKPKADSSPNNQNNSLDFAQRVKMAKTRKELDALYEELKN